MKKIFLTLFGSFLLGNLSAQNPLWLRHSSISPDGKNIAFSYKGDIYKISTQGGEAQRLTSNPAFESFPIWSPDSKQIAFTSDREGGHQKIYIMSSQGGEAKQLTFNSANAIPYTFTKDGKSILYITNVQTSAQSAIFNAARFNQLYKVSTEGNYPELVSSTPMAEVKLSPDGKKIYYEDVKGFENEWRKHHTSSVSRDIWQYDFATKKYTKLIDWQGEDRNPVLAKDGKTIYFLSERNNNNLNIFKTSVDNPSKVEQLTFYKDNPVRFLSISDEGLLSFGYDGELYTLREGNKPNKINVKIINDISENQERNMSFSSGATSANISPDGKQIAFAVRGEIFASTPDYSTTKQISKTTAAEQSPTFSPDGRSLVYASYREGFWDLYKADIARKEEINFANSTLINEEKLIKGDNSEKMYPKFSPNGKEIAFVKDRNQVVIYNFETKKTRNITDAKYQIERNGYINYSWSPDGKWLVVEYVARNRNPYSDIGIISTEGGKEIFNITDSGYFDNNPHWALDGDAIIWNSERYGMRNHASWGSMSDVMIVFLNREAFDKYNMNKEDFELYTEAQKKEKKEKESDKKDDKTDKKNEDKAKNKDIIIEFDNLRDRIVRLTPNSSVLGDAIISKDGKKLYYLSSFESGYDLWMHDLREKTTKLLSKLNGKSLSFKADKDGKNIFLLGSEKMQVMELPSEKIKTITYKTTMKLDLAKEREFMFEMVKREINERFYVKDLHGVNWDKLTNYYYKFLPYINNNYDYVEMLSELLGELNVSHTGARYRQPKSNTNATALLGAFVTQTNKGLVIDEILPTSPLDNFQSKAKKGNIIEKIDNQSLDKLDFSILLEGKIRQKILISLYDPNTGTRWEEVIKTIDANTWNELLYKRWVKQREENVEKWSNGKLGYVHIRSMADGSFRDIYANAMGKYFKKDGMVIDIRYNGGGRLHEDIEVFFSAKKYLTQMVRGKVYADMPSRRWTKPSIMVMNEADYSNAHGTPWVYKEMKIGKLVGMPVPGTMTSVNWVTLQDPSVYFGIPVVGYLTDDGKYLENLELYPDITAPLDPLKLSEGEDTQLKTAVEELLKTTK
ncbi:MAG: S41 family peptidase [Capnocytophaga sp.]|nr:S41 family peptidase [Capnocytophaga sp.]